jgi:predicted transcriptional regulator
MEELAMNISKKALESCIADMPDFIDTDEVMHRIYLLQKIEAGEADIRSGNTLPHDEAVLRLSQKWHP